MLVVSGLLPWFRGLPLMGERLGVTCSALRVFPSEPMIEVYIVVRQNLGMRVKSLRFRVEGVGFMV
jgi:hypothetical protein